MINKLINDQHKIALEENEVDFETYDLKPNKMQEAFIGNIHEMRENGAKRALLISATGTGKTYASAFAMKNENPKKGEEKYIVSEKEYEGKITNISAGGCCIQTDLPIKEKQYIGIILPDTGIDETIVGIIRRTRRLPTGKLALHIQFIQISLATKNRIHTLVYKYEL